MVKTRGAMNTLSFSSSRPSAYALAQCCDQIRLTNEQHPVSGFDHLQAETHRQVRPAYARWAEHDDFVAVLDEVAACELLHLLPVDRRLVAELEALEPLDELDASHGGPKRDVLRRLGRDPFAKKSALNNAQVIDVAQDFRSDLVRNLQVNTA